MQLSSDLAPIELVALVFRRSPQSMHKWRDLLDLSVVQNRVGVTCIKFADLNNLLRRSRDGECDDWPDFATLATHPGESLLKVEDIYSADHGHRNYAIRTRLGLPAYVIKPVKECPNHETLAVLVPSSAVDDGYIKAIKAPSITRRRVSRYLAIRNNAIKTQLDSGNLRRSLVNDNTVTVESVDETLAGLLIGGVTPEGWRALIDECSETLTWTKAKKLLGEAALRKAVQDNKLPGLRRRCEKNTMHNFWAPRVHELRRQILKDVMEDTLY